MSNLPAVNLARKYWGEFFQSPRAYYSEEQIVNDLYKNVKVNVYSFSFLLNGDEKKLKRQHDALIGRAIRRYYAIEDIEYPLPADITPEEYSFRILKAVWKKIHDEMKSKRLDP